MSTSQEQNGAAAKPPQARKVDLKLEAVVIPVSDVDRAKSLDRDSYCTPAYEV
jgi:hypothetical protein